MGLGATLEELRTALDYTRATAADELQVSAEHLRNIERDKSRPSPQLLSSLIDLYDPPVEARQRLWVFLAEDLLPWAVRRHVRVVAINHKEDS